MYQQESDYMKLVRRSQERAKAELAQVSAKLPTGTKVTVPEYSGDAVFTVTGYESNMVYRIIVVLSNGNVFYPYELKVVTE